jgi:hypothetical protein
MQKLITPLAVATLALAFAAPEAGAQYRRPPGANAGWGRPWCPPRPWCPAPIPQPGCSPGPRFPQPGCYPAPKYPRPYCPPRPWRGGGFPRHGHR